MADVCIRRWALALIVFGAVGLTACGNEDLVFPGMVLPTETPTPVETPTCLPSGDACTLASDCCSGQCITQDGVDFMCQ